jgi:hypothetical protein
LAGANRVRSQARRIEDGVSWIDLINGDVLREAVEDFFLKESVLAGRAIRSGEFQKLWDMFGLLYEMTRVLVDDEPHQYFTERLRRQTGLISHLVHICDLRTYWFRGCAEFRAEKPNFVADIYRLLSHLGRANPGMFLGNNRGDAAVIILDCLDMYDADTRVAALGLLELSVWPLCMVIVNKASPGEDEAVGEAWVKVLAAVAEQPTGPDSRLIPRLLELARVGAVHRAGTARLLCALSQFTELDADAMIAMFEGGEGRVLVRALALAQARPGFLELARRVTCWGNWFVEDDAVQRGLLSAWDSALDSSDAVALLLHSGVAQFACGVLRGGVVDARVAAAGLVLHALLLAGPDERQGLDALELYGALFEVYEEEASLQARYGECIPILFPVSDADDP